MEVSDGSVGRASDRSAGPALAGICLGFFLVLFDATAVNVATGPVAAGLDVSVSSVQWVLNAYTVAFAALMLTAGSLGDRWGSRRTYLSGAGLFAVASSICAVAPSAGALIAARAVQGVGAAAVVPCSLALIAHRFPAGRARARALGIWGGVSGIGLAAGPVTGGWLVSAFGWRSVFLVVVPITAVSMTIVAKRAGETPCRPAARVDVMGQVLAVIALVACTTAFSQTSSWGWIAPPTLGLFCLAVIAGLGFIATERRATDPMLPLPLFRTRAFSGAVNIGLLFNFNLYGVLFCVTIALENGRGFSASKSGFVLLPLTAVVATGALASGVVTNRYGVRLSILAGLSGGLTGALLLALFGDHAGPVALATFAAVLGLVGLAMPAMTSVALAGAGQDRAALGSAVLNAARQTGGAFGVALLGSVSLTAGGGSPRLRAPLLIATMAYLLALTLTGTTLPGQRQAAGRDTRTG